MTLGELKGLLREGYRPEEIEGAYLLGEGYERKAWKVGPFVVKQETSFRNRKLPLGNMLYVRRYAPTLVVNGWEIQLAYRPLPDGEERLTFNRSSDYCANGLDFHARNVGYDHRNRMVAFDW